MNNLNQAKMKKNVRRTNKKPFLCCLPVASFCMLLISGCLAQGESGPVRVEIERYDPRLDKIAASEAKVEVLAEGFDWTEGPLWVEDHQMLLFSDIPQNSVYKWTEKDGVELYLKPSGYTNKAHPRGGETGANGLLLDPEGQLVLCQHGDRRIALMQAPLDQPKSDFVTIVDNFQGKKLDSPNDAVYKSNGDLYFTDPPYGLEKNVNDPLKEAPYQGVYKVGSDGEITLLLDSLSRPNGIAFFPGEGTLIIANSDPYKPYWYAYDLDEKGDLLNGRVFYDAMAASKEARGMPDGLKIDKDGNVFATGPGGVWVFNKDGEALGRIKVNQLVSNCAFSDDGKILYLTADGFILKVGLGEEGT